MVVVYLSSHRSAAPSQRSKDFGGNAAPPDPYGQGGFGAGRFNGGGFADQDEVACSSLSFLLLSYLFLLSKGTRDLVKFRVVASFLSSTCFLSTLRVLSSPVMLILIVFQPSHVLIIACLFVCKKNRPPSQVRAPDQVKKQRLMDADPHQAAAAYAPSSSRRRGPPVPEPPPQVHCSSNTRKSTAKPLSSSSCIVL